VGWSGNWEYFFKHRRKILRRCTESDTHANTFSDPHRYGYGDGNCNAYGNNNTQSYTYTYFNAKSYTFTTTTPHTGASPVRQLIRFRVKLRQEN